MNSSPARLALALLAVGLGLSACGLRSDAASPRQPGVKAEKSTPSRDSGAGTSPASSQRTLSPVTPSTPVTPSPSDDALVFDVDALGPAQLGMTMDEFAAALGLPLTRTSGYGDPCWTGDVGSDETGVWVLTEGGRHGRVSLIDVSGYGIADVATLPRTAAGVGVGSTAAEVRAAYPGLIQESPHAFNIPDGQYLTVTDPKAPAGPVLLFETDDRGQLVTEMRSGEQGAVFAVEGCS